LVVKAARCLSNPAIAKIATEHLDCCVLILTVNKYILILYH